MAKSEESGMFIDIPVAIKTKLGILAALSHPKTTRKALVTRILTEYCDEALDGVNIEDIKSRIKINIDKVYAE